MSRLFRSSLDTLKAGPIDNTNGLVGWYLFEDNAAPDYSGYGNKGVVNGSFIPAQDSPVGGGCVLDGTTNFVTFTSTTNLNLATATSEKSTTGWFKAGGDLVITNFAAVSGNPLWVIQVSTGNLQFVVRDDAAGGIQFINTGAVNDSKWHHYAATRTTAKAISIYLDGVFVTSNSDTMGTSCTFDVASSKIQAGTQADFRIYRRALTPDEIWAMYSAGKASRQIRPAELDLMAIRTAAAGTAALRRNNAALSGLGASGPFFSDPLAA